MRWVRTGSGAVAVQIGYVERSCWVITEHLGSAHCDVELEALWRSAHEKVQLSQPVLDFGVELVPPAPRGLFSDGGGKEKRSAPKREVPSLFSHDSASDEKHTGSEDVGTARRLETVHTVAAELWDILSQVYHALGFDEVGDEVFKQLVIARVVEPTSKRDARRVIADLGQRPAAEKTIFRHLASAYQDDYRSVLSQQCFHHVGRHGNISLTLYDVTTLYFETEKNDGFREPGFSKERRIDPQITVGLLTDRHGFPLEVGAFEGNKAEKRTIIPIVKQFRDRYHLSDFVVVADAGMLSRDNLRELHTAGFKFIVGSRTSTAPHDLAKWFTRRGNHFDDGAIVDTVTPRGNATHKTREAINNPAVTAEPIWTPHNDLAWRAIWQYRTKRAVRDTHTLTQQKNKALAVVNGEKAARMPRFVTRDGTKYVFNETRHNAAMQLVGLKGYVTNIPVTTMKPEEVISSYHELWHIENSFRMAKHDLQARPIFHRTRDSIEAHLTVVFAAMAISKYIEQATGKTRRHIITTLRALRGSIISIGTTTTYAPPKIPTETQKLITAITNKITY